MGKQRPLTLFRFVQKSDMINKQKNAKKYYIS